MSRVLNRPMFRLGGSTSGITSGLDTPKRGRVDGPGGYSGEAIDYDKIYGQSQKITDKYYPRRGGDINRFLINWGLNMAGNAPSGNIFQTAAKEAQEPTKNLFASMDQSDATRSAIGADLFGKMITAEGELLGGDERAKTYKDKVMLDTLLGATKDKIRLTKQIEEADKKGDNDLSKKLNEELILADTTINQIRKRDPLVDKFLGSNKVVEELLAVILPAYDNMMIEDPNNPGNQILKYPKNDKGAQTQKIQDAMREIMIIIQTGASGAMAKGGRVGYAQGELVEDVSMQETIQPGGMPNPMEQAPEVAPVSMTYDELRARLPDSITDDIVILLSESGEALEDFATIQTQQDVDDFNRTYNVNLVLPSEA